MLLRSISAQLTRIFPAEGDKAPLLEERLATIDEIRTKMITAEAKECLTPVFMSNKIISAEANTY